MVGKDLGIVWLLALLALPAAGQGVVRGVVYDSLLGAHVADAEVWVQGTALRARTDADGRFHLEAVPPGRHVLAVTHVGFDSAGIYAVTVPFALAGSDTAQLTVATPSLATFWRRRCGTSPPANADSGLVFGVIQDAATGSHLAGAAVLASWVRLEQRERNDVAVEPHDVRARTDSLGVYYACGVAPDMTVGLRAYAGADSSGLIDVRPGARPVARQDLTVALASPGRRASPLPAALRGTVVTIEGRPAATARVSVREAQSTVADGTGAFLITGLPGGTQWVSALAIGRLPAEQAVDLRSGDTVAVSFTVQNAPVTLAPLSVTGERWGGWGVLAGIEERRRIGLGYVRTEAELAGVSSMRTVFATAPSVRLGRARSVVDFVVLLPRPGAGGRGYCVAPLFIDGHRADYDQLAVYQPSDLKAVEVYVRPSNAPLQFQSVSSGCGVVLVWTK
jgi:hypothetical protein